MLQPPTQTCCSTVGSDVQFITCSRLRHHELVILSERCLAAVPQVHAQLVVARGRYLMEVGET